MAKKYIDASAVIAEIERRMKLMLSVEGLVTGVADNMRYQGYKSLIDFINSLQQEQPCEDLEEAAEKYAYQGIPEEMKSKLKPIGDEVIKNFKAGAEWQKEQMLKDAVKGTVCKDKECVWIELIPNALPDYEDIEPVKCVVMKED